MKLLPSILIVILSLFCGMNAHSREWVIALSPYMEATAAKQQTKAVLKFVTALEAGDKVTILDGYHLRLIGSFNIPENPAYNSPKARLGANRSAVAALLRFAGNVTTPDSDSQPTITGAVRLPHLLRHIGENFPSGETRTVVLLGSPLYEDLETPQLSMTDECFPSDGHLFASIGTTPYGTAGNAALLAGFQIHIGYGDQGMTGSDRHDHFIRRFWTLYIEQRGGTLASFVPDLPTLFHRIENNTPPPKHDYTAEHSNKLEIVRLAPVQVQKSIYDRPVASAPLTAAQSRRAEQVEIGISWDCQSCDLDLYAQAHPSAQPLYFGHTKTPEGRYWKDYRNSPKSTRGYETVVFGVPLDLRALRLAVNFYSGEALQGVSGEIRIAVDGQTYAAPFQLEATKGNGGATMKQAIQTGQAQNKQTLFIDPLQVVGLR